MARRKKDILDFPGQVKFPEQDGAGKEAPAEGVAPVEGVAAPPAEEVAPAEGVAAPAAEVDAPGQPEAPAGQPGGEMEVSADKIDGLIAERKAAGAAAIEAEAAQNPGGDGILPPSHKEPWEMTSDEIAAQEAAAKPKRGRKPKADKGQPGALKEGKGKGGRPPKSDKDKGGAGAVRDNLSQSDKGKAANDKASEAALVDELSKSTLLGHEREEVTAVRLNLDDLHPFHTFGEHPFHVQSNPSFKETAASIKKNGVWTPAIVRPEKDGNGYEIISGHCRAEASREAGFTTLPCIVLDLTDEQAFDLMKDSNKQRHDVAFSERAALLKMEVEKIKHQGARANSGVDLGKRSVEIVGANNDMNYKMVMRYIRLNSLIPGLLAMTDAKKLDFTTAVELSFIRPKCQKLILNTIEAEEIKVTGKQAQRLRELDKENKLTADVIDGILTAERKEEVKVVFTGEELYPYFGKDATPKDMKKQIIEILDAWKEQNRGKEAPAQDVDRA